MSIIDTIKKQHCMRMLEMKLEMVRTKEDCNSVARFKTYLEYVKTKGEDYDGIYNYYLHQYANWREEVLRKDCGGCFDS